METVKEKEKIPFDTLFKALKEATLKPKTIDVIVNKDINHKGLVKQLLDKDEEIDCTFDWIAVNIDSSDIYGSINNAYNLLWCKIMVNRNKFYHKSNQIALIKNYCSATYYLKAKTMLIAIEYQFK